MRLIESSKNINLIRLASIALFSGSTIIFFVFSQNFIISSFSLAVGIFSARLFLGFKSNIATDDAYQKEKELYGSFARSNYFQILLCLFIVITVISVWAMNRNIGDGIPVLSFAIFGFSAAMMAVYALQYR